jgi:hypothetical protein
MRAPQIAPLLLTAASCLAGHLGWAQRAAVAPLMPLLPVVQSASVSALLGAPISMNSSRAVPAMLPPHIATQHSQQGPIYLLNAHFIINELRSINPQEIAQVVVYKGADVPPQWQSLTEHGLVAIALKPGVKLRVKTKSLGAIRRQTKASGTVSFRVNGLRVEDPSLRVAAAIAGLDVVRTDSETIINIRLAPPRPTPSAPPGTIHIRGVASR